MNCAECKELLVTYVEGLLDESQKKIVTEHLKDCSACQAELKELTDLRNRLVNNGKAMVQSNLENVVLDRIIREQNVRLKTATMVSTSLKIRRIIMKSKIVKLAAAAVIIIAVVLTMNLLDKSIPAAYALEHTIEANHTVRYLHIKVFKDGEDEPKEFWVECNEYGQISSARLQMPEWGSPEDGAKVGVWKENKVQIWFKRKNTLFIAGDKAVAEYMLRLVEECDPRLAVERLYQ